MNTEDGLNKFYVAQLSEKDVDAMVSIIRTNLDPFEEAGSVLAATYRRLNRFWDIYTAAGAAYWLVRESHTSSIVGGAGIGPFAGLNISEKIGEIRELVIQPQYRGMGAGKLILRHCLDFALQQGYQRIYLETTPQMQHAQQLFLRFNFKPVVLHSEDGMNSNHVPCYFMLDKISASEQT